MRLNVFWVSKNQNSMKKKGQNIYICLQSGPHAPLTVSLTVKYPNICHQNPLLKSLGLTMKSSALLDTLCEDLVLNLYSYSPTKCRLC